MAVLPGVLSQNCSAYGVPSSPDKNRMATSWNQLNPGLTGSSEGWIFWGYPSKVDAGAKNSCRREETVLGEMPVIFLVLCQESVWLSDWSLAGRGALGLQMNVRACTCEKLPHSSFSRIMPRLSAHRDKTTFNPLIVFTHWLSMSWGSWKFALKWLGLAGCISSN